ncbi:hypothetical protein lerEdw1_003096 [Lerista edwardsae]|nr:hypothetical protein lerEdw1_003096 [Lerista edwardsae]
MESLSEPLLVRILASVPAVELVLVCRLVCSQWKNLIDGAALWLLKCQQDGFAGEDAEEEGADNWQTLYFLNQRKRNLIKNPSGEGKWSENVLEDRVRMWCRKAQVIDLRAEGYWEELLDTTQPKIVVKDWYAARCDAGCLYDLSVTLLSENEDVVAEYRSDTIAVPQDNEGEWTEITHTFTDYGPGVRFIRFEHGGQDTVFWKGWYGARVTHSHVTIEP